jgi:hypothetical protein
MNVYDGERMAERSAPRHARRFEAEIPTWSC